MLTKEIFGSESDEFMDVHSPQSSASYNRGDSDVADERRRITDLVTADSNVEVLPPMLSFHFQLFIHSCVFLLPTAMILENEKWGSDYD